MKITKITIENFKSIKKIEFDIKKFGDSYTTMLLGINESGKSNILQAMSFLDTPKEEFNYNTIHNQKDEKNDPVDLWFGLDFHNKDTYTKKIKKKILNGNFLNFEISSIVKNVYLQKDEKQFSESFDFEVIKLTNNLFIKKISKNGTAEEQAGGKESFEISKKNDDEESFKKLTEELFKEFFKDDIAEIIKNYEPNVSFWKPSDEYLISDIDLNEFKDDIKSNTPLKHIFALSGFTTEESVKEKIEEISNMHLRSKLMSLLSEETTKYIKNIWNHKIDVIIEISETLKLMISIKDNGAKNKHDRLGMSVRSEGFKQFISLILSLSVEAKKLDKKNQLILIDEPETHLHPSGIRDLSKELLEIGETNYLFVSTHSPFLVDRIKKERNIIIKKNTSALTEKKEIKNEDDIRDDEVLDEAFGINVYKDLLIPHRILVEGYSDKLILQKAFSLNENKYGITNGTGSNIVQIASKLNHDDIKIMVITDDDAEGKEYKDKILKIGSNYSDDNVFTIRDLVGNVKNEGTIEDLLGKEYIESKFKEFYLSSFSEECNLDLDEPPFIKQVKIFLQKEDRYGNELLDEFKKKVSEELSLQKSSFNTNFPLLNTITEEINKKLQ